MAKKKNSVSITTNWGVLVVLFIIFVGVLATVTMLGNQTYLENHAAEPSQQVLTNLNRASEIISTVNADGTMGPRSSYGNWSNSLPAFLKGKLVFAVMDPVRGGIAVRPAESTHVQPTHVLPSQAQQGDQGTPAERPNGPQTVTTLNLTVSKVEVHMSYQGTRGSQDTSAEQSGKPSITPSQQGQAVDHWETLNVTPTTIDLVQLATSHTISSLGITELAAGRYTEVRLYVNSATATLSDGATVTLKILGKDNIVRVVQPFTVGTDQATTITMDFDAQHSVVKAGDTYLLKPVVARLLQEKA